MTMKRGRPATDRDAIEGGRLSARVMHVAASAASTHVRVGQTPGNLTHLLRPDSSCAAPLCRAAARVLPVWPWRRKLFRVGSGSGHAGT